MSRKFTSTIVGASVLLTVIGILNKGIGFIREMLYARNFGLSQEFNAYLVSAILPVIIYSTIFYLGQYYFIPSYNKIISKNESEGDRFLSDNFWIFFIIGWTIVLILFFLSDSIINFYLSGSTESIKITSVKIFRIYIFTIPLSAAHSVLAAFLNAKYRFKYPAISVLILNAVVVLFLLLLTNYWDIFVIPYAFVSGMVIQLFFLSWVARKSLSFNPFTIFKIKSFTNVFNTTLLLTVLVEIFNLSYILVDRYFLDKVGEGGIASLSYAYTLYELPVKIFAFAIATAIFAKFSRSFNLNSQKELGYQFQTGIKISIFFFVPVALILYYWGDVIIQILYQRGKFTSVDTVLTFRVLKIYVFSIVFYASYSIVNKMIYSARLLKELVLIAAVGVTLKIILNVSFVGNLQQQGLAFSTSIAYLFLFTAGFLTVVKKLNFGHKYYVLRDITVYLVNGVFSFGISRLLASSLSNNSMTIHIISFILFALIYSANLYIISKSELILIKGLLTDALKSAR